MHFQTITPKAAKPKTFEKLISLVKSWDLEEPCVWRGQANFCWAPIPSLYRRLRVGGFSDKQINESVLVNVENDMVGAARAAGLCGEGPADVLRLMVDLQHYGGATRLLDVTHDYRVALFFACNGRSEVPATLIRYSISRDHTFKQSDGIDWNDLVTESEPGSPLLLDPLLSNPRIKAQRGAFITTRLTGSLAEPNIFEQQTSDSRVRQIFIAPALIPQVQSFLRSEFITEKELFPVTIETFAPQYGVGVTPRLLK